MEAPEWAKKGLTRSRWNRRSTGICRRSCSRSDRYTRVNQNDEMFKLVERIETEEKERKDQLLKTTSEEERIKLRKQHIDKKAACQKQIKELMKKHHEENEYLEQKIEDDRLPEAKKQNPDEEAEGQEEQGENEAGQEEDEGELAGEEEMVMA